MRLGGAGLVKRRGKSNREAAHTGIPRGSRELTEDEERL